MTRFEYRCNPDRLNIPPTSREEVATNARYRAAIAKRDTRTANSRTVELIGPPNASSDPKIGGMLSSRANTEIAREPAPNGAIAYISAVRTDV